MSTTLIDDRHQMNGTERSERSLHRVPIQHHEQLPTELSGSSPPHHLEPTEQTGEVIGTKKEDWNSPVSNIARVAATCFSFVLLGINDSSYGVLLPHLENYYGASHLQISLVFLPPVAGFIVSTLANHFLHVTLGRRGIALIAGTSHCIAYAISCSHPPIYGLVLGFTFIGLGSGLKTASWNIFISGLNNANELLGLLHGAYGLGATICPLFASNVLANGWTWYMIYYVLVGLASLDMIIKFLVFRTHNAQKYLEMYGLQDQTPNASEMYNPEEIRRDEAPNKPPHTTSFGITMQCLKNKVVILCSLYLLAYVGSEVALGGWLVTFMIEVRGGNDYDSGMVASGLWAGITVGRIVLGFVTARLFKTEKSAVFCYLSAAMALELMLWLIPSFLSSAICAAFLGFFLGPLFPCVIVCMGRRLPRYMLTTAIGIASAVGASGASVLPFMVGAIAQAKGVMVLQPIIFSFLVLCMIIWFLINVVRSSRHQCPLGRPLRT